jgi:hypothetical protein
MLYVFSQEMHIFVFWNEPTLDVSSFFLTAEYGYDAKGGWNFKAEIC